MLVDDNVNNRNNDSLMICFQRQADGPMNDPHGPYSMEKKQSIFVWIFFRVALCNDRAMHRKCGLLFNWSWSWS